MGETIPVVVSDMLLKAPEEVRKSRRARSLLQKVERGELPLAGLRERSRVLSAKNAAEKQEKGKLGALPDAPKKRLRASELLQQASENVSTGATRKEAKREQRALTEASTKPSKRFKL